MAKAESSGSTPDIETNINAEGNMRLMFEFLIKAEGTLPQFDITLDGMPLLTIKYHRDTLSPLFPPEESKSVQQMVERFERVLPAKMQAAVAQLFVESEVGGIKQPLSFFDMLANVDNVKGRVGIKKGRKAKLSTSERDRLDEIYDDLHQQYQEVKAFHDDAYKQLSSKFRSNEQWRARWGEVVKASFTHPDAQHDLLERVSDPDPYLSSPSEIAYEHLSHLYAYKVEYLKKLVTRARGKKKSRETS